MAAEATSVPAQRCKCGLHELRGNTQSIAWYWGMHTLDACTVADPEMRCWCGTTHAQHQNAEGHAPGMHSAMNALDSLRHRIAAALQLAGEPSDEALVSAVRGLRDALDGLITPEAVRERATATEWTLRDAVRQRDKLTAELAEARAATQAFLGDLLACSTANRTFRIVSEFAVKHGFVDPTPPARPEPAPPDRGKLREGVCWHCHDVILLPSRPRCESCPEDCDLEGCEEPGCADAVMLRGWP